MVLDSVNTRSRRLLFERSECESLRLGYRIPERTRIWIGRYVGSALSLNGTDIGVTVPEVPEVAKGHVTTILVGHLAIQVLVLRVLPEYQDKSIKVLPKSGPWNDLLLNIWPISSRPVTWPPHLSFTKSGSLSIARIADRWRIGAKSA
jgi:hypothetical protein